MLIQDANNLSHLCFDAREPLGCLAFKFQVATLKLQVRPVGFRLATKKRGLVLKQRCQRLFKPIVPVLGWSFSCQSCLRSCREQVLSDCISRGDWIRTSDLLNPIQAR